MGKRGLVSQGMRPGWDTIQNERIHHYKQYHTETSSEETGQNCLGHNDPPTAGLLYRETINTTSTKIHIHAILSTKPKPYSNG